MFRCDTLVTEVLLILRPCPGWLVQGNRRAALLCSQSLVSECSLSHLLTLNKAVLRDGQFRNSLVNYLTENSSNYLEAIDKNWP